MAQYRRGSLRQVGMTLIELIMVVVIVGLLAAFAVPKYVNLKVDSENASVLGTYGALKSSFKMVHAQWVAEQKPSSITLKDGSTINMTTQGYPVTAGGVNSNAGCASLWNDLLDEHPDATQWMSAGIVNDDSYYAYGSGSLCLYLYRGSIEEAVYRYIYFNSISGFFGKVGV